MFSTSYSIVNIQTEDTALESGDFDAAVEFLETQNEPANFHVTEWEYESHLYENPEMWEINKQWFGDEFLANEV